MNGTADRAIPELWRGQKEQSAIFFGRTSIIIIIIIIIKDICIALILV
jgi:hypothetical protein